MNQRIVVILGKKVTLLSILVSFFLFGIGVSAEEVSISVKPVLPENQLTKDAGYYDLKVSPGQEQILNLEIFNTGNEDATVNLEINPAYTGDGGSFDYTRGPAEKDESLIHDLSMIASVDKVVSIPKQGKIEAQIKLKIPTEPIEGIILGAVRVTTAEAEEKVAKEQADGVSIENKFAYVVAIQLHQSDVTLEADLKLKGIVASQVAGRNTVKVNLQNPTARIINQMSYEAQIYRKGQNEVLHSAKYTDYRIAPNTNFNVPINWENQAFRAGTYQLKLIAKSAETIQEWNFDQEFIITQEEAKKLNETAAELETDNTRYIIYGAIGLAAVILILVLVLAVLSHRKKRKKAERRKQKVRKKTNSKSSHKKRGSR